MTWVVHYSTQEHRETKIIGIIVIILKKTYTNSKSWQFQKLNRICISIINKKPNKCYYYYTFTGWHKKWKAWYAIKPK